MRLPTSDFEAIYRLDSRKAFVSRPERITKRKGEIESTDGICPFLFRAGDSLRREPFSCHNGLEVVRLKEFRI